MDMKNWQDYMHELMSINQRLDALTEEYDQLVNKVKNEPEFEQVEQQTIQQAARQTISAIDKLKGKVRKLYTKIDNILNNRSNEDG
jgi:uncharacterized protein YdcH (DUF465 family)